MSACPAWRDRLLDTALGASASKDLAEHLRTCAACSNALAELYAVSDQMDAGLRELVRGGGPAPGFRARLFGSLESRRAPRTLRLAPVGVVVAIVVVAVLGVALALTVRKRADLTESASTLLRWQSPTEVLLRSSGDEFLQSPPRLGEFYFPMPGARPAVDAERRKRRSP